MIIDNINTLINDTSQKEEKEVKEGIHIIPAIPLEIWLGMISAYLIYKLIRFLYIKFSTVHVSPQYLKYYNPLKVDFFNFLDIVKEHSDEYTVVRTTLKGENLECEHNPSPNKELECVLDYVGWFSIYKIDVIISTLYDDGYDLVKIRTIDDIYTAKYTKTPEFNALITSLKSGVELFKSNLIQMNNQSMDEFGIPVSRTYRDFIEVCNKRIKKLVVISVDWK